MDEQINHPGNGPKINAEWHAKHIMPKNPTLDQRVEWHLAHARHCSCHPLRGKIKEEFKKRYENTCREFWIYFSRDDHVALACWAADCAGRVLPYFEAKYSHDPRPRQAIQVLRDWMDTGRFEMRVIRAASLGAHAAAREAKEANPAACFASRAAGQAVATTHVPDHALGAALYALKAINAADPPNVKQVIAAEREWQLQNLPPNLREWVIKGLKRSQRLIPPNLRI